MKILARAVGRRKEAVAQIQIIKGTGKFIINNKAAELYLQNNSCSLLAVTSPFLLCDFLSKSNQNSSSLNFSKTIALPSSVTSSLVLQQNSEASQGQEAKSQKTAVSSISSVGASFAKELQENVANSKNTSIKTLVSPVSPVETSRSSKNPLSLAKLEQEGKDIKGQQKKNENGKKQSKKLELNLEGSLETVSTEETKSLVLKSNTPSIIKQTEKVFVAGEPSHKELEQKSHLHTDNKIVNSNLLNFSFEQVDTIVKVKGGGLIGQTEAIKLGVARALCNLKDFNAIACSTEKTSSFVSINSPGGQGEKNADIDLNESDLLNQRLNIETDKVLLKLDNQTTLSSNLQSKVAETIISPSADKRSEAKLGENQLESNIDIENLFKKQLKTKGYLTQDSRVKERRKYGLKKARKASQYHKR